MRYKSTKSIELIDFIDFIDMIDFIDVKDSKDLTVDLCYAPKNPNRMHAKCWRP